MTNVHTRLPLPTGEPVYRGFAWTAVHAASLLTRPQWSGMHHIPDGGALVVANHISNFDPVQLGHYLLSGAQRYPRFIGKAEIWRVPVLGWLARSCGQIPVERHTDRARDVLDVAADRISRGQLVCMYPEGTITADPLTWPMVPRTGAARLALRGDFPVIPVGLWGAHRVMPGKKLTRPRLLPRKPMQVTAGPPVELGDLRSSEDHEAVARASARISDAITTLVEQLRGETRPDRPWDLRAGRRVDPHE